MGRAADRAAQGHLPGAVVREQRRAEDSFAGACHRPRARVPADQRPLQASLSADAQNRQQLRRHADKGIRLFLRHHPAVFPVAQSGPQLQGLCAEALDGFADQLPQPVRSGKGETDHRHAPRPDQLPEARHEKPDGIPAVPFGIKNPLGGTGGARGGVGEHPPDLRLRAEQQAGRLLRQVLLGCKGKSLQFRKAAEPLRQIPVIAVPFFLHRQNAVQLLQLNRLDVCSVQGPQALLLHDKAVDPAPSHVKCPPKIRAALSLPEFPCTFQNSPP